MSYILKPAILGVSVLLLVLAYTIHLVRSEKLSAHMAISWIIAEIAFLVVMMFEPLRVSLRSFLGEQNAPFSLFLLGAVWIVFLMLESLTRISSLTNKLKQINQELALTQERLKRAEQLIQSSELAQGFDHAQ
ncbi:DUF2304 domain-containing protein [Legionella jordanis]|uniref:Transmembrane protein n=1 Tax=Legionella jordanis TaxID=456 RepID=A0A0W0VFP6_9GAMM|nr:DUF2304 domain-containing protein [Legionella jordanis]KTD18972.1 hypothetical protein Ljor_0195 [Legionella jordanis]RMX05466.1 DUF2304 domain-containing protein [Legionella jordanis]RMX19151.1 DUF2304 domain-containing protein [Legionella jordanis]VEH13073.1 Uncharacterized conserved protein [Legionella jordanis]HAT8714115.1 DUF2304 family protein [Legionella jordanis]